MVIGTVCLAVTGMLHKRRDLPPQLGTAYTTTPQHGTERGVLDDGGGGAMARDESVDDLLSEIHGPGLGRGRLGKIVTVPQHGGPDVPVQIMDGAAAAQEEGVVLVEITEGTEGGADGDVEMGVITVLGGDDGGGGAGPWEHADEDQVDVVDPVVGRVGLGGDARRRQVLLDGGDHVQVRVELVVLIFGRVDVGDW